MARLTRKEMKRDEVLESFETGVHWMQQHARTLVLVAVGMLVVALGVVAFFLLQASRGREANTQLAAAMEAYGASKAAGGDSADAHARFQELLEEYGGTDAGAIARLYLGEMAAAEGDLEEARRQWSAFVDRGGSTVLVAQAQLNLLHLERAEGRLEEVEARLREILADTSSPLPEDQVLRELAVTLDSMDREGEAEGIWRRLLEEHPASPWAAEARERTGAGSPGGVFPGIEGIS